MSTRGLATSAATPTVAAATTLPQGMTRAMVQQMLVNDYKVSCIEDVLKLPGSGNDMCADCLGRNPRWASINIGVFICHKCSGCHRDLGTHVSKVRSVTLDAWTPEMVLSMVKKGGNRRLNMEWEANLPARLVRPTPDEDMALMKAFIRDKYERRRFASANAVAPAAAN